jgi:hypothetical protein
MNSLCRKIKRRAQHLSVMLAACAYLLLINGFAKGSDNTSAGNAVKQPFEIIDLDKFDHHSVDVDNKWLPMWPGTRWIYEGTTIEDNGKVVSHRVEINITNLTKVISGVRTLISYDLDYSNGQLEEAELAFFAQDNEGNVWHFGQYPEEYKRGKFTKAPAWIHGFENARAGITMKADPQLGTPSYSQGWGPAVDWTDRGIAYQMGQKTSVRAGTYDDVLVIKETARSEVDAEQLKYYARAVGNVRVGWAGKGEKTRETLELVKVEQLDPRGLAEIDAKALKLEKSAYKRSKNVYGGTRPAEFR